ncbi:methyl-accepting chemotaxis protein [Pollutimonas thiosulfatoxidans]|nr:methyl-accepting chemotaxis protein [Pollutimonas thiosulfatoxidans]
MKHWFTLKNSFVLFLAVLAMLCALVIGALYGLTASTERLKATEQQRSAATALATGYKNMVQAMSRDVMAFVASEQPEFQESYEHLRAVLEGRAPDEHGVQQAILERLRMAGYTQAEMDVLEAAHAGILELAATQREAISTASGQFDDGKGGIKVALPNALMAKVMIFGQQYADAFAAIMRDIDRFNAMQTARHDADVQMASAASRSALWTAVCAMAILLVGSAVALWALYRSVKRPLDVGVSLAERLADGQLTARIAVRRRDELGKLLSALNGIGAGLHLAVHDVRDSAQQIATTSEHISRGNEDLSQRSTEQAANLQQTAGAMEELAVTVRQNADHAERSSELVAHTDALAEQCSQDIHEAAATMQAVRTDARKVADISGLISGIAFQSNILALNAAVEAARAGQHGRGFAVVATEVRALARRSDEAARDIERILTHSVQQLDGGTALVEAAERSVEQMAASMAQVRGMTLEIAQASREQANGIEEVNVALGHLETITQHNVAMVQKASGATRHQHGQANSLMQALSHFALGEDHALTASSTL